MVPRQPTFHPSPRLSPDEDALSNALSRPDVQWSPQFWRDKDTPSSPISDHGFTSSPYSVSSSLSVDHSHHPFLTCASFNSSPSSQEWDTDSPLPLGSLSLAVPYNGSDSLPPLTELYSGSPYTVPRNFSPNVTLSPLAESKDWDDRPNALDTELLLSPNSEQVEPSTLFRGSYPFGLGPPQQLARPRTESNIASLASTSNPNYLQIPPARRRHSEHTERPRKLFQFTPYTPDGPPSPASPFIPYSEPQPRLRSLRATPAASPANIQFTPYTPAGPSSPSSPFILYSEPPPQPRSRRTTPAASPANIHLSPYTPAGPSSSPSSPFGRYAEPQPAWPANHPVVSAANIQASTKRRKKEALFACDRPGCGQTFTANHNLKNHINVHDSIKPHRCEGCDYSARTLDVLKRHQRQCSGMIGRRASSSSSRGRARR
ncbi:hypothetical protein C8F01DRAFT_1120751 [Mycena amicta]|nr:hypothetical protein C8F01DRAFT_1120751 [Mycena amicta]